MIYACYAMYLIDGNTLTSLSIKNNTLKLYLNSAGAKSFHKSLCVHQRGYTSNTLLCYSPLVNAVVKEHNRWMKVPHRREPVTKNMIRFWLDKYFDKINPMSLEAALLDWMILGAKRGFRKSEWFQDVSDIKKNKFNRNIDNTIKAFVRDDWEFTSLTKNYKEVPIGDNKHNVLKITWRYQKNNQNGETIPFVRDKKEPRFCPVAAAQRRVSRAKALKVGPSEPLAVFADNFGNTKFIHNLHVRSYLREAAINVYKIKIIHMSLHTSRCMCSTICRRGQSNGHKVSPKVEKRFIPNVSSTRCTIRQPT